jgi:hypothetical protein
VAPFPLLSEARFKFKKYQVVYAEKRSRREPNEGSKSG